MADQPKQTAVAALIAEIKPHVNTGTIASAIGFLIGLAATAFPAFAPYQGEATNLLLGSGGLLATGAAGVALVERVHKTAKGMGGRESAADVAHAITPVLLKAVAEVAGNAAKKATPPPQAINLTLQPNHEVVQYGDKMLVKSSPIEATIKA